MDEGRGLGCGYCVTEGMGELGGMGEGVMVAWILRQKLLSLGDGGVSRKEDFCEG